MVVSNRGTVGPAGQFLRPTLTARATWPVASCSSRVPDVTDTKGAGSLAISKLSHPRKTP